MRHPTLDPESHFLGEQEATIAFIVTLDTVNFGSGYFPHLRKRPGMSGYFTLATSLTKQFRHHGPWDSAQLQALTPEDCAQVFHQQPLEPPVNELMELFAQALNDLGQFLDQRHEGSFKHLVECADHRASAMVQELAHMPLFNDVATHKGEPVAFYKRAQLTAGDLSLAFQGQGPGAFEDLERLTIFADNLVPHVLRCDGVLAYDPSLARAIDAGDLIEAGSPEEVEIRACAVHAVECLVEELHAVGSPAAAMQLDYVLWNKGQAPAYKARPRHRCRTPFY